MMSINGILIMDDEDRAAIEADIGPLASLEVIDVIQKLELAAEQREQQGYLLWAKLVRVTLDEVKALSA